MERQDRYHAPVRAPSLHFLLLVLLLAGAGCDRQWGARAKTSASGTVETDEVHIASRYGGRVEKIFAQEGDTLQGGEVIVQLEAPELKARHDQAAGLLAELEAGARPEELESAKHDWQAAQADLEFALAEEKRIDELFANKTVAASEQERTATHARALEQSVAAAKSRYDLLRAGTRPERLVQARAQLAEIEAQLDEMRILAPTQSVLEVLSVKIADVLPANREVATLILLQHLWVRVYVPEPWLGFIKPGQTLKVKVDSFPQQDFEGVVEQISRASEFTPRNAQTVEERIKRVFGVKVRLTNPRDQLRAGMSADVYFPEGVPRVPQ
jgi:HlyD family secretion protein